MANRAKDTIQTLGEAHYDIGNDLFTAMLDKLYWILVVAGVVFVHVVINYGKLSYPNTGSLVVTNPYANIKKQTGLFPLFTL